MPEPHERRDPVGAVHRLLHPSGIAVVGVSATRDNFARRFLGNTLAHGPGVPVVAVNPRWEGDELLGAPCVRDVSALPPEVDVAVFAQPPGSMAADLRACAEGRIAVVQVITATLGDVTPQQLADGPRVVGPNSYGCLNPHTGLSTYGSAALAHAMPRPGGVAMVAHSGAVSGVFVDLAAHRGVGIRAVVTTGDEVDLDALHVIDYLALDDATTVVAWYVEGIGDRTRFEQAAIALAERGKRLVVLAPGRTRAGQQAVHSHTGHVASDSRALDGLLEVLGVTRVHSLHDLVAACAALDRPTAGRPAPRATVLTTTGGVVSLAVDDLADAGIGLPPLPPEAVVALDDVAGAFVQARNPLDLGPAVLRDGVPAIAEATATLAAAVPDSVLVFVTSVTPWAADAIRAFARGVPTGRAALALWLTGGSFTHGEMAALGQDIPVVMSPRECAVAIAALAEPAPSARRRRWPDDPASAVRGAIAALPRGTTCSEQAAKQLLAIAGITVPAGVQVPVDAAGDAPLPPADRYVVKAETDAVVSRGSAGLVLVDVQPADITAAVETIRRRCQEAGVHLEHVRVEAHINPRVELFVGMRTDPVLGAVLALGIGGELLHALDDVTVRPLPVDRQDVTEMLQRVGALAVLRRTFPQGDVVEDVLDCILRISGIMAGDGIDSLDVNPLAVTADGRVVALDGAIVTTPRHRAAAPLDGTRPANRIP